MKVSIITICFNSERTIRETIDSVLAQSYSDIEYIVVDGQSTDNTLQIVESYGDRIAKIVSEKDDGIYDAMNKGLALTTGDIIGFINADDVIDSNQCIERIVETFQRQNCQVVYGDKIYVDPDDTSKVVRYWKVGAYKRENYRKGWMTPHLSTYIAKNLYDEFGNFRTDFQIAADYELMLRFIYKNNAKVCYLPMTIAKMRAGGISNSSLSNVFRSNLEVYKSWQVNGLRISPFIILQKPLRKVFQLFRKG